MISFNVWFAQCFSHFLVYFSLKYRKLHFYSLKYYKMAVRSTSSARWQFNMVSFALLFQYLFFEIFPLIMMFPWTFKGQLPFCSPNRPCYHFWYGCKVVCQLDSVFLLLKHCGLGGYSIWHSGWCESES